MGAAKPGRWGLWVMALTVSATAQLESVVDLTVTGGPGDYLGRWVHGAGDVDGDGRDDLLVLALGRVEVRSGVDGALLHSFPVDHDVLDWKHSMVRAAPAGDVDRDGHGDVLVGDPFDDSACTDCGKVVLYSGATGRPLFSWTGTSSLRRFGGALAGGSDLDGDGVPDLLVSSKDLAPNWSGQAGGQVWIYSGRTGETIQVVSCGPGCESGSSGSVNDFGHQLDFVGDVDGDGVGDWASCFHKVSFTPYVYPDYFSANGPQGLRMYSGATGTFIREWSPADPDKKFTWAPAGDTDGDGVPDLVVHDTTKQRVLVISGATGEVLLDLAFQPSAIPSAAGDVDGDGHDDIALGRTGTYGSPGRVSVYSGLHGGELARWISPEGVNAWFGRSVALAGDVAGDGKPRLVAGGGSTSDPTSGSFAVLSVGTGGAQSYGAGCAGSLGVSPQLSFSGVYFVGTEVTVSLGPGSPGSLGLLWVSLNRAWLPTPQGCVVLIDLGRALSVPLVFTGPGPAFAELHSVVPPQVPADLPFFAQAFVADIGSPAARVASQGVRWSLDELAPVGSGPPQTLWVDAACTEPGDGSAARPFCRIQDGLDAAQPGDTVQVRAGHYTGVGNTDLRTYGKAITVRSESGPFLTVLDAEGVPGRRLFLFTHFETEQTVIEGFTLTGGHAVYNPQFPELGGGAVLISNSSPRILNCILRGNLSEALGGGLACLSGSPRIRNCWIVDNQTLGTGVSPVNGGGVFLNQSAAVLESCTIAGNRAHSPSAAKASGAGVFVGSDQGSRLGGCIVWGNVADNNPSAKQVATTFGTLPALSFSVLQGWTSAPTILVTDPLFVDAAAGDYHVLPGSPCIDAGNPAFLLLPGEVDIDGEPRIQGTVIDIGADERP